MSHFSKRHFPDLDIKELINQYKQYHCLWDYNSPEYKCKASKQEAWQEIANYFQKDINEVKRKVKYLRSGYVAEKRKVDASRKTGTQTPYKPSLFYYSELNFLDNIVISRKYGNDADNTDFEFANTTMDTQDNEEFINFENEDDIVQKKEEINCKVETFAEYEPEIPFPPRRQTPKVVSARSLATQPVKRKISGEIKFDKSVPANASFKDTKYKNLYLAFGKTIALQLQQLPFEIAILAMSEIQTILTKKTLEHMKYLPTDREESQSHSESEDSCNELIEENFNDSS